MKYSLSLCVLLALSLFSCEKESFIPRDSTDLIEVGPPMTLNVNPVLTTSEDGRTTEVTPIDVSAPTRPYSTSVTQPGVLSVSDIVEDIDDAQSSTGSVNVDEGYTPTPPTVPGPSGSINRSDSSEL